MQTKNVGHMSAWSLARSRGYTGTREEFAQLMADYATVAERAAQSAQDAENAKEYVDEQTQIALQAARDAAASAQSASGAHEDAASARTSAQNAQQSETDALNYKNLAQRQAENSEAWAVGTRDGVDVGTQDETYHNNAKYYAGQLDTAVETATTAATNASQSAQDAAASASAAAESARTLTIDPTLTQEGQAADAKQTGDEISGLKSGFNESTGCTALSGWIDGKQIKTNVTTVPAPVTSSGWRCLSINCTPGDVFTLNITGGSTARAYAFADSSDNYLSDMAAVSVTLTNYFVIAPSNAAKLILNDSNTGKISFKGKTIVKRLENLDAEQTAQDAKITRLEKYTEIKNHDFTNGAYIKTVGAGASVDFTPQTKPSESYAIVDCKTGQHFLLTGTPEDNSARRAYMFAYLSSDGQTWLSNGRYDSASAMIDKEIVAPIDGKLIVNFTVANTRELLSIGKEIDYAFKIQPLTNLPEYFVRTMAYKPVGELENGYVCLTTDDGWVELATMTIPYIITKNVPVTFSLMRSSHVFDTEENKAIVLDAVNNHGCSIAQHGGEYWYPWTEEKLNSFFDEEKEFWDTIGVTVKSAVIPGHQTTDLIKAVAGGRFGVVRSGFDGNDGNNNPNYSIKNYYDYYSTGARSNIYGLSSNTILTSNITDLRARADYAKANKKILICHWHDNNMTADRLDLLGAFIDYCLSIGLTFINLEDIATVR